MNIYKQTVFTSSYTLLTDQSNDESYSAVTVDNKF